MASCCWICGIASGSLPAQDVAGPATPLISAAIAATSRRIASRAPRARGSPARSVSRTSGCSSSFSTIASTTGSTIGDATYSAASKASRNNPPRKIVRGSVGSGMSS